MKEELDEKLNEVHIRYRAIKQFEKEMNEKEKEEIEKY